MNAFSVCNEVVNGRLQNNDPRMTQIIDEAKIDTDLLVEKVGEPKNDDEMAFI